jgi:hypothetical protein
LTTSRFVAVRNGGTVDEDVPVEVVIESPLSVAGYLIRDCFVRPMTDCSQGVNFAFRMLTVKESSKVAPLDEAFTLQTVGRVGLAPTTYGLKVAAFPPHAWQLVTSRCG